MNVDELNDFTRNLIKGLDIAFGLKKNSPSQETVDEAETQNTPMLILHHLPKNDTEDFLGELVKLVKEAQFFGFKAYSGLNTCDCEEISDARKNLQLAFEKLARADLLLHEHRKDVCDV